MKKRKNNFGNYATTIILCGDINEESASVVVREIESANYALLKGDVDENSRIKLVINSGGGDIYAGATIISSIEQSVLPVDTYVYGSAFSMAFIIAISGDRKFGTKFSSYMWHGVKITHEMASLVECKIDSEHISKIQNDLLSYVCDNTKLKKKVLSQYLESGSNYFMSAQEAKKNGVIDEIV